MSETVEKLKEEIEILTNQERADIARFAIHSLDQGTDDDAEAAWEDDVRVREREKWPSLRKWAIERMGVFREALQPHLDALDQPGDSGLEPRMRK